MNPFDIQESTGISIVCAVKNRMGPLRYTIPSYLNQPGVSQIVLVDWDSDQPVRQSLQQWDFPEREDQRRITHIRAVNQPYWNSAKAYNLAMSFVTNPFVFKVDADVVVVDDLRKRMPVLKSTFVTGNFKRGVVPNDYGLFGSVFLRKEDFDRVGGYDERFVAYGFEDNNFFRRLQRRGLKRKFTEPNALYHLPHSNAKRTEHQQVAFVQPRHSIRFSRRLSRQNEAWSAASKGTRYELESVDHDRKFCVVAEKTK